MAEKPTYKELEQRIKELEKEAVEHTQAKEELKKSEQKYQHLTESLLDTVYEFDREGRFTYVNEAGTHMFGYSKQEILNGLRVQDTMIERDRAISQKVIGDIFNENTTVGERAFLRKDGSQFIGEIHSGPIYMGDEVVGVRGMLRDITSSKQAEVALKQERDNLQDALAEVKTLSGLLPICAHCKKIRDDKGYWNQIEAYISDHSEADFSHSICPECAKNIYPEFYKGD